MPLKARINTCHPERKHKAKGLCISCYYKTNCRDQNKVSAVCHPDRPHGALGLCKPCYMRQFRKEYVTRTHVAKRRKERNWEANGIILTTEQYDGLLKKQNNKCAVCLCSSKKTLAVDHCHDTGRIRGLLCDYCNRRLLIKKNTSEILQRAINYLTQIPPTP